MSPLRYKRALVLGAKSLWLRRLRSLLTALGIVFGVASVIAMLAIGEGASSEAQEQIRLLGSQNIIIDTLRPTDADADEPAEYSVLTYGLTERDLSQISATVPRVRVAAPVHRLSDFARWRTRSIDAQLIGTVPEYPELRNIEVLRGRSFNHVELAGASPVCTIDNTAARHLFPAEDPLGRDIRFKGSYFKVIGITSSPSSRSAEAGGVGDSSTDGPGSGTAHLIIAPLSVVEEFFGETLRKTGAGGTTLEKTTYHELIVAVDDADHVVAAANAVRRILSQNHRDKGDYRITVPVELLQQAERTKRIFNTVLGSIAAISLLVGGIGIMNIMLATVTERTREIGVRRALGARRADIVAQFLIETVLLAGAGGLLGVALGLAIPAAVSLATEMTTIVRLWAPTLAFSISLAIGLAFGIYPAMRAAQMHPVDALRHE